MLANKGKNVLSIYTALPLRMTCLPDLYGENWQMLTAADLEQTFTISPWGKLGLLTFSREVFSLSVPFFWITRSNISIKAISRHSPATNNQISIIRKTISSSSWQQKNFKSSVFTNTSQTCNACARFWEFLKCYLNSQDLPGGGLSSNIKLPALWVPVWLLGITQSLRFTLEGTMENQTAAMAFHSYLSLSANHHRTRSQQLILRQLPS